MGAEAIANDLLTSLTAGQDFTLPTVNLTDPDFAAPTPVGPAFDQVQKLTNEDLTSGRISGSGTFDALMNGFKAHLDSEFAKNRISGAEYTKAYTALTEAAMQSAVQFLLGKDQAFWQAIAAQAQARMAEVQLVTAKVQLETAKAQLVQTQLEVMTVKTTYALTKLKLATESVTFDTAKFSLDQILPAQKKLVNEQVEAQRAQTLDTRSDGHAIAGSAGAQKALYAQQVESYKRDADVKIAKIFSDAWTVQRTTDDGLSPPDGFTNASLDNVLTQLKVRAGLS
jgi:outer membrane protein OmpA-like peptidoglycan-associated protein